jgi:hypothetical protein
MSLMTILNNQLIMTDEDEKDQDKGKNNLFKYNRNKD